MRGYEEEKVDGASLREAQGISAIVPILITPQVKKGKKLIEIESTERVNKLEMTAFKQSRKHHLNKSLEKSRIKRRQDSFNCNFWDYLIDSYKSNSSTKKNILENLKLPTLDTNPKNSLNPPRYPSSLPL